MAGRAKKILGPGLRWGRRGCFERRADWTFAGFCATALGEDFNFYGTE